MEKVEISQCFVVNLCRQDKLNKIIQRSLHGAVT